MKQLLTLFALTICTLAIAQQGTIIYEEALKLEIDLPEGIELPEGFPDAQVSKNVLYFNGQESTYKAYDDQSAIELGESNGDTNFNIKIKRPEYFLYKNLAKNKKHELREFFGKRFIIEDDIDKSAWKIGTDTKEILGYQCTSALLQDTSGTTIAWFTTEIPITNGPGKYSQLPGLILEVNINDGKRTLSVTSIDLKRTKTEEIQKPSKGKVVTQAQFDEIIVKKMKEMGAVRGEGGTIKMIVTEDF
ncbi:MAG: GLPGLI family protein [Bacteroidota bacterium]